MDSAPRFRVNTPKVICETFEDEVVVVNLDTGHYYSLEQTGTEIWKLIEQSLTSDQIVGAIRGRYEDADHRIEASIRQWLDELQQEALIAPLADSAAGPDTTLETQPGTDKRPFTAPILNKFSDMQDLLLLDPIHEVDDTGWPTPKVKDTPD